MRACNIVGTGSFLPGPALSNAVIEAKLGPGVARLAEAVGIQQRHLAVDTAGGWRATGMLTSHLARHAIERALHSSGLRPADLEAIVMVTSTPDHPFPSTATLVQEQLGIEETTVFELRAACSGVAQAFALAHMLVQTGKVDVAAVVGAELSSSLLDFESVSPATPLPDEMLLSAAMFGDGAGAAILAARERSAGRGVFQTVVRSIGGSRPPGFLCVPGGAAQPAWAASGERPSYTPLRHDFRAILHMGPTLVWRALNDLMASTGMREPDFDLFIPPQANVQLMRRELASRGIDPARVFVNADQVGNTSSASILVALDAAICSGRIQKGDTVALLAAEASKWLYGAVAFEWSGAQAAQGTAQGGSDESDESDASAL